MIERLKKLITRRRAVLLGVIAALFTVAFTQWRAAITRNRSIADEPFQIAGNLYYVGHTGVTALLLTGPEGHVLIDTIRLGPIALTAHVTAGHTRGCTSWEFPVAVEQDTLMAVSIYSLTLFPFVPLNSSACPGIRGDFERSFATLRSLPADIFLGSHSSWFSLYRKHRAQAVAAHPAEPFIDPEGYRAFVDRAEPVYLDRVSGQ